MKLPEYVTVEEVRRVCKALGISDWTKKKAPHVSAREAKLLLKEVNAGRMKVDPEEFRVGLEVELEHGMRFRDANVTNNHPLLTGKIVMAHFKESLEYYKRLEVAELEGDLLKAIEARNPSKVKALYKRLAQARRALSQTEMHRLASR